MDRTAGFDRRLANEQSQRGAGVFQKGAGAKTKSASERRERKAQHHDIDSKYFESKRGAARTRKTKGQERERAEISTFSFSERIRESQSTGTCGHNERKTHS